MKLLLLFTGLIVQALADNDTIVHALADNDTIVHALADNDTKVLINADIDTIVQALTANNLAVLVNADNDKKNISTQDSSKLPTSFEECVDFTMDQNSSSESTQRVQRLCLDMFITVNHTTHWRDHFSEEEQNFISSIFRKLIGETHITRTKRRKRDVRADKLFQPRERREIRDQPYSHFRNFALAVRRLKRSKTSSSGRNQYDTLAHLHVLAAKSVHQGPAFLCWHKLYLIVAETAFGTPIPYWNSVYDYYMRDPTDSCIWTDKYFGNPYGYTRTGPFQNFRTPLGRLFRNCGSDGSLFNIQDIKRILSHHRYRDITEPTAKRGASVEGAHAGAHIWCDGIMNNVEYSAYDPVFFCHHAFTDYIYDVFRGKQKKRGIDPSRDYIEVSRELSNQGFDRPAARLHGYRLFDGLSETISQLVTYIRGPRCPSCNNSPDLKCRRVRGGHRMCVSRHRDRSDYSGHRSEARHAAEKHEMLTDGRNCDPFAIYETDGRVRHDSVTENVRTMSYASMG